MSELSYGAIMCVVMAALLGSIFYMDHSEKMGCMRQHGTYANKSCAFPQQAKP